MKAHVAYAGHGKNEAGNRVVYIEVDVPAVGFSHTGLPIEITAATTTAELKAEVKTKLEAAINAAIAPATLNALDPFVVMSGLS